MKKNTITYLMTAASLLAFTACMEKELVDPSEGGIRFGVTSEYDNDEADTRTEYSGQFTTSSPKKEIINWLNTDKIRIVSAETADLNQMDYTVNPNTDKSTAAVNPVTSGAQFRWNNSIVDHYFFAVYPAPASTNGISIGTPSGGATTVTGSIPADQSSGVTLSGRTYKPNMNYAYMYAAKKQRKSEGTNVTLEFNPLVTAFQFSLISDDLFPVSAKMTKAELSASTNLAGSFKASLNGNGLSGNPTVSGGTKTLSITFPNGGIQLSKTDATTFTFLALPVAQTNLTLKLTFADGLTRTLQLKSGGSSISVEARKKVYVSNLATPGNIYYDMAGISNITIADDNVLDDNVRTVTVNTEKDGTNGWTGADRDIRKTPWKAYFVDGSKSQPTKGTVITGNSDYQESFAWLQVNEGGSGAGKDDAFNFTIKAAPLIGAAVKPGTSANAMITNLKSNDLGTVDLSRLNFIDGGNYSSSETANCYIINGYGTFLIPLVYGNAIKNGSTNSSAYSVSGSASNLFLTRFLNADGREINTPYILNDGNLSKTAPYNGCVVWQDTQKTFEIVKDSDITIHTSRPTNGTIECAYLEFKIRQENIKPGNVVIALRDKNNKILWSWHIWVRSNITSSQASTVLNNNANKLHAHKVTYLRNPDAVLDRNKDKHDIYFLSEPLGWTPPLSYEGGHTNARSVWVAIVSTETQAVLGSFKVTQNAHTQTEYNVTSYNIYSACYYQWGRKDPFLPTNGKNENKIVTTSQGYQIKANDSDNKQLKTKEFSSNGPSMISYGIQHPFEFNSNYKNKDESDRLVDSYRNLWDIDNNEQDADSEVKKTIYDPSPRGYTVTRRNAYTGGVRGGEDRDRVSLGLIRYIYSDYYGERDSNNGYNSEWPAGRKMTDKYDDSSYTLWIPAIGWRGYYASDMNYYYLNTDQYGKGFQMYYWTAGATESRYTQGGLNRIQATSMHAAEDIFHARNRDCRTDGFPIIPTREGD